MILFARAFIALVTSGTLVVVTVFTFFAPFDVWTAISWLSMSITLFQSWDLDCVLADAGRRRTASPLSKDES